MSERGGRRAGSPGATYAQRTDLNTARNMTPTPSPVQGSVAQLAADKTAVPTTPTTPAQPPAQPPAPYAGPEPGAAGPLTRPTEQPQVPVTAGLPTGPGPGPAALSSSAQTTQWQTGHDIVAALAANPNSSPAMQWLASRLQGGM